MNGADLLRHHRDELLATLAAEIAQHIPRFNDGIEAPSHPLRRQRQKALRLSLEGMAGIIDARHGVDTEPTDLSEHVELGRMERRFERPLGDILRAPWAASRTIIRFVNDHAAGFGLLPAAVQEATEVVVEWSDMISIAFSEGYNDETAARAGELEANRQQLLRLALAEPPVDHAAVATAAAAAGWRPPSVVQVLVATGTERSQFRRRLPAGSVAAELDDELLALIPATTGNAASMIDGDVDHAVAALGLPVPLAAAAQSARLARRAIALGAGPPNGRFIDCASCELDLVLLADQAAATALSRRLLSAIVDRPALVATLDAWLASQGRPKSAAAALGVHPHTVAYRIDQVRQCLGPIIDDPSRRLELHVAVHIALRQQQAWPR